LGHITTWNRAARFDLDFSSERVESVHLGLNEGTFCAEQNIERISSETVARSR
jgi:hypothetical protein